jgi:hypothetical protein
MIRPVLRGGPHRPRPRDLLDGEPHEVIGVMPEGFAHRNAPRDAGIRPERIVAQIGGDLEKLGR